MKLVVTGDTHFGFQKDPDDDRNFDILTQFWVDVAAQKPDAVLHAGDWGMTFKDMGSALKQYREWLPRTPTWSAYGNHDFWQQYPFTYTWQQLRTQMCQVFDRYDIQHPATIRELCNEAGVRSGIRISVMDGWYHSLAPKTNDLIYMPRDIDGTPTHAYLNRVAQDRVETLWVDKYVKHVLLTHFDPDGSEFGADPKLEGALLERFDLVVTGHSHRGRRVAKTNGHQLINAGSGYNEPQFVIVNL